MRFDTAGGRSFALTGREEVITAHRIGEVRSAIERAEVLAGAGMIVGGYLAYEAAPAFDHALYAHPPLEGLPLVRLVAHREREAVSESPRLGTWEMGRWKPALEPRAYGERIETIRDLLAAGDSYQVNFTFPLRTAFRGDPLALYLDLLDRQRAGYSAYLDLGRHVVLSLSPELFFARDDDLLRTRPMKGTRPRGRWPEEDAALRAELAHSEKDRAENLMIVDMLRNDVGRLADPGTVNVPRLFDIERYPTVHQMTSTVEGRVPAAHGLWEVLGALFPCGSVTGAPKVRTMEIIRSLEPEPRGVYCGAVGFLTAEEAVFNVPIRTLLIDRERGEARMGVGSGIVYDSRAEDEYDECLAKAAFTAGEASSAELLETMRWDLGIGVRLLDRHLARISWSAERLGYAFDREEAERKINAAGKRLDADGVLRLRVARTGTMEVDPRALPANPATVRLAVSDQPVRSSDDRLYHKTTDRARYDRRRQAVPEVDDVILLNERGEVTEATLFNVVARVDGECVTPPISAGLLPGVMRAELLSRGEVRERSVTLDDLRRAEAIWVTNAVRGLSEATLVS